MLWVNDILRNLGLYQIQEWLAGYFRSPNAAFAVTT